jgi:hypothetical protein
MVVIFYTFDFSTAFQNYPFQSQEQQEVMQQTFFAKLLSLRVVGFRQAIGKK